eukprot:125562-Chlamydomonas_euryale.AAC.1
MVAAPARVRAGALCGVAAARAAGGAGHTHRAGSAAHVLRPKPRMAAARLRGGGRGRRGFRVDGAARAAAAG